MIEFIRSTVRPFVTYALTGLIIYMTVKQMVDAKDILIIVSIVIAFWFASKASEKKTESQEYIINVSEEKKKK